MPFDHAAASRLLEKKLAAIAEKTVLPASMLALVAATARAQLDARAAETVNVNAADLDQGAVNDYVSKSHELTLVGFAMDIIPKTLLSPLVGDNILQVLLVAVLFGIALALTGERGRPVDARAWLRRR